MAEINYIQELLNTGKATEGSLLIVKKIHDTLIAEVAKTLIPRSEAAILVGPAQCPGSSYDIDLENPNTMDVRIVAEGADVVVDEQTYTSINVKPLKYGVSVRITREMLEDAKWNLLERNVATAGKRLAENENSLIITALDSATTDVSGGAAITIANVATAMLGIENYDYIPTTMLVGAEVLSDLRNIDTFVEADKLGSREMLNTGFIGTIFGLKVLRFSTNAAPSSTYAKYAYIFDNSQAYTIVEKRPVTVERFMLPANDMEGAVITQRIAVALLRAPAIARITTS